MQTLDMCNVLLFVVVFIIAIDLTLWLKWLLNESYLLACTLIIITIFIIVTCSLMILIKPTTLLNVTLLLLFLLIINFLCRRLTTNNTQLTTINTHPRLPPLQTCHHRHLLHHLTTHSKKLLYTHHMTLID